MKVLLEVFGDLYDFVFKYKFGFINTDSATSDTDFVKELTQAIQIVHTEGIEQEKIQEKIFNGPIGKPLNSATASSNDPFGFTVYVRVFKSFLHILPTRTFDGVIMKLNYEQPLNVINQQGQWLQVKVDDIKGWVHEDDVTDSLSSLLPQFELSQIYDAENITTLTLRILIDDDFFASQIAMPLQDVEYVTYRLSQKNRIIHWSKERPRIAGTWQRLLKGINGIHLGISPKTDSVMEYINADDTGHVAYVDSVFPDGSISLSEIGYPTEAMFMKRTLTKDEWKELRPVFIEVS
jgi:hypothetical protein